jgi:RNA-directed DNA polymerase
MRRDLSVSRYADDFYIRVGTWPQAISTIEFAAEYARDLGLILSYEKTKVDRAETIKAKRDSRERTQRKYFDSEKERLTFYAIAGGGFYDDVELVKIEPSDADALKSSMRRVLDDWHRAARHAARTPEREQGEELALRRLVPLALTILQDEEPRIEDDILAALVSREPIRLERVCKYVLARAGRHSELDQNWETVRRLISAARMSPWARIWLLNVAGVLPNGQDRPALAWVADQMIDRHEVVRAEAAWASAKAKDLDKDEVVEVLRNASQLTQAGVVAAIAQQGDLSSNLVNSILSENPLLKKAYEWGQAN